MSIKMKNQMKAIIKKDLRGITSNHRMFVTLLVVPLVLTIFVPTIFLLAIRFAPAEASNLQSLLEMLPREPGGDLSKDLAGLLLNYMLPAFFLLIPIMASSVTAASSFVGEKEKQTLETLLYSPLSLRQIFRSKVLASFLLGMSICLASFAAMLLVLETEAFLLLGSLILPDIKWALILLLVSPSVSMIAITLIVRVSAKAQSVEDAQQSAVFLILPILFMLAGQFTGVFLISSLLLLALGTFCAVLAFILLKKCMGNFRYENLL